MKAQIVRIGNSQGIRIPKIMLEESGISGEVELELTADGILVRPLSRPRSGWDGAFAAFSETDDDTGFAGATSQFDRKDWQW